MRSLSIAAIDSIVGPSDHDHHPRSSFAQMRSSRLKGVRGTNVNGRSGRRQAPLRILAGFFLVLFILGTPELALAQASPFMTGATALQTNLLAWLTPVAIILVMVLGGMAMANRLSWGWCIGAIMGIAIGFGAPQIVTWVRGMFGV
ncbi:MAG TPA: TrbC/VirB2 family protein [Steroidobacteraceae bacterium]|jgi:type IV secretion system protein VirB2